MRWPTSRIRMLLLAGVSSGAERSAGVRVGRSHPPALPCLPVPSAAGVAKADRDSRNLGLRFERGRTFRTGLSGSEIERESSPDAGARPSASARTQPGTNSHGDHCARGKPTDTVKNRRIADLVSDSLFVRAGRMSPGHNAGQVLLETQVRFAGKSVRVRPDGSKKTVYFPLDFVIVLDLVLPCGARYRRSVAWCFLVFIYFSLRFG